MKHPLFQHLKHDLPASIAVFLVALPLCMGVALASGAPLLSGIVSGIIGGVVVGVLSKSHISVSGPAAGLTAVVLSGIQSLPALEAFWVAVSLAGVFQWVFGWMKLGRWVQFIPESVINGLLAAIGLILISNQLPFTVGLNQPLFGLLKEKGSNIVHPSFLSSLHPATMAVSGLAALVLFFWEHVSARVRNYLPASLFVVLAGSVAAWVVQRWLPAFALPDTFFVNLPTLNGNPPHQWLHIPQVDYLLHPLVWKVAFTLACIASIETLLNMEAIGKIDPYNRTTDLSKELYAQGLGNALAGLAGGIPLTSVVVRSSVNINAGNRTRLSAILHGIFLLLSLALGAVLLNHIPLACLSVLLIGTGYKLTQPKLFAEQFKKGYVHFVPFMATIVTILFSDLLVGVIVGFILHKSLQGIATRKK